MVNCFFSIRPYSNDPWSTVYSASDPTAMINDQLFLQRQILQQWSMINCFFSLRPYSNDPWSTVSSASDPTAMIHDQLFLQPQILQQWSMINCFFSLRSFSIMKLFPLNYIFKKISSRTQRISHRTNKPVTMLKYFVHCYPISEKNCFVWGFCDSERLPNW